MSKQIRYKANEEYPLDFHSTMHLTPQIPRRLSENGYFPQSLRQAQIIILEILPCIPVVRIFAFLDLGKNISFSDSLLCAPLGRVTEIEGIVL